MSDKKENEMKTTASCSTISRIVGPSYMAGKHIKSNSCREPGAVVNIKREGSTSGEGLAGPVDPDASRKEGGDDGGR